MSLCLRRFEASHVAQLLAVFPDGYEVSAIKLLDQFGHGKVASLALRQRNPSEYGTAFVQALGAGLHQQAPAAGVPVPGPVSDVDRRRAIVTARVWQWVFDQYAAAAGTPSSGAWLTPAFRWPAEFARTLDALPRLPQATLPGPVAKSTPLASSASAREGPDSVTRAAASDASPTTARAAVPARAPSAVMAAATARLPALAVPGAAVAAAGTPSGSAQLRQLSGLVSPELMAKIAAQTAEASRRAALGVDGLNAALSAARDVLTLLDIIHPMLTTLQRTRMADREFHLEVGRRVKMDSTVLAARLLQLHEQCPMYLRRQSVPGGQTYVVMVQVRGVCIP